MCYWLQLIGEAFVTGIVSVIGGIIPLGLILLGLFYWARESFRLSIDSEKKIVEQLEAYLIQNKESLNNLQTGIEENRINVDENIALAIQTLQSATIRDEADIIMRKAWIDKVENANFFHWFAYYFKKKYFGEFFKK